MAGDKIELFVEGLLPQIKEVRAGIEGIKESILEANKAGRNFEFRLKDAPASMSQLNELVEEAVKNLNTMAGATNELDDTQKKEAKTTAEVITLLRELNKLRKESERQKKSEEKQVKELQSDYAILNKAYREQVERVRALFFAVGELSPAYQEARQSAMDMSDTLKRIDAAVGIHNRNVGNYNMVLNNLGQIWRELPNAGISLRTFVTSLSNNLIPLIESFKELSVQNKQLAAQGKPTQSAMGLIKDSLFGVTGIASLLTTGLIVLTSEMEKSEKQAGDNAIVYENLASALKGLVDAEQEFLEAIRANGDYGAKDLERRLDILRASYNSTQDYAAFQRGYLKEEGKLRADRISQLEEEQKRYNETLKAAQQISEVNSKPVKVQGSNRVANSLGNPFGFGIVEEQQYNKGLEDFISRFYVNVTEEEKNKIRQNFFGFRADLENETQKQLDRISEEIKKEQHQITIGQTKFAAEEAERLARLAELRRRLYNEAKNIFNPDTKDITGDIQSGLAALETKGDAEILREILSKSNDKQLKKIAQDSAETLFHIERRMNADLEELNAQYLDGRIRTQEDFEKKRTALIRKYAIERLRAELGGVQAQTPKLQGQAFADALKREAEIRKEISDLEVQQFDEANQNKINSLGKFLATYRDVMTQIGAFAVQVGRNITEADLAEIKQREANLNIDLEKRKRDAAQQAQTEMQFNKLVTEAEFQAAQDREALRQEEIRVKQRQAIFDKANAVAQAIINSALAVTTFLAQANVPGAIAAGIAGGVQVGTILATPLPQYKEGTGDHPGGGFIAGEGGEREIVIRPDGTAYMVPAKPGYYSEPKHTRVIPEHDWGRMPMLTPALLANLNKQDITTERMERKQDETNRILNRMMAPRPKDKPRAMLPSHFKR